MDDATLFGESGTEAETGEKVNWKPGKVSMSRAFANVSIETSLSPQEVARVRAIMNRVDPKLRASLARDLRRSLTPLANNIVSAFPTQAPLSGMTERWGGITAKVSTSSMAKPGRALALFTVRANPAGFARLLSITERAGSRSQGITPQGKAMISNPRGGLQERYPLDGSGGRFVFRAFRQQLPDAVRIAREAIDRFIDKFNRS